jgi:hypothetical protein
MLQVVINVSEESVASILGAGDGDDRFLRNVGKYP